MNKPEYNDADLAHVKEILRRLQRISIDPDEGRDFDAAPVAPIEELTGTQSRPRTSDGLPSSTARRCLDENVDILMPRLDGMGRSSIARSRGNQSERRLRTNQLLPAAAILGVVGIFFGGVMGLWDLKSLFSGGPSSSSLQIVQAVAKPVTNADRAANALPANTQRNDSRVDRLVGSSSLSSSQPGDVSLDTALSMSSAHLNAGRIAAARTTLAPQQNADSPDVAWLMARSYDPSVLRTLASPDATADVQQATFWYRRWYELAVKQGQVTESIAIERIIRSMQ